MTIKTPIKAKTMLIGSIEIYVAKKWSDGLKQVGVYKDHEVTAGAETVEDVYSNITLKKVKNGDKYNISFSMHEQRPEIMEVIEGGLLELETISGGAVSFAEKYRVGEWGFENKNVLKKQDVNGVPPTNVAITITKNGVTTPLVSGTDFTITPLNVGVGYFIVGFITGSVLSAGDENIGIIDITYDVTEGASQKLHHKASGVAKGFVAMVVWNATYDGQDMRQEILLENVQNDKGAIQYRGDSEDDTAGYPCNFSGTIINDKFIGFE